MFTKPSSVTEHAYYYSRDPAFDVESEAYDHQVWSETGDEKYIPRKPGGPQPTSFVLRPLSQRDRFWLHSKSDEGGALLLYWAVAVGVSDIKGMLVDGEPHRVSRVRTGSVTHLSDLDMDLIATVDDGALLGELARRILMEPTADPS